MKFTKHILMTMLFLCSMTALPAQSKYFRDSAETHAFSEKIAQMFTENRVSDIFEALSSYWPMPQNEIDQIEEKTIKYINLIQDRYGKTLEYQWIKTESIQDFALRETYIIRFDKSALRIVFTYYRNNKGWLVNAFKWDELFAEEFK